jgi:hypothetical protein
MSKKNKNMYLHFINGSDFTLEIGINFNLDFLEFILNEDGTFSKKTEPEKTFVFSELNEDEKENFFEDFRMSFLEAMTVDDWISEIKDNIENIPNEEITQIFLSNEIKREEKKAGKKTNKQ